MSSNTTKATDDLSNDYVAQVLASEARDSSLKYSAQGMGAYLPRGPTGAAPKPNTRFLRNIIRETDSHNTSLKRKEEREARERMRQLRVQASSSSAHGTRRHDHYRSRHQLDESGSRRDRREDREKRYRPHKRRHGSTSASPDRDSSRRHRPTRESHGTDENRKRSSRIEHRHRPSSRSRRNEHVSESRHGPRRHRQRSRSRSRTLSPDGYRRRQERNEDRHRNHRSSRDDCSLRRHDNAREKEPSPLHTSTYRSKEPGYVLDPLEDLVGPLPPKQNGHHDWGQVRTRGRGAYRPNTSNIDAHFASDYDPTLDVHMEDDDLQQSNRPSRRPVAGLMTGDDDWELALETLRDRARWKMKEEERLREAGFDDAVVNRWKNSSSTAVGNDGGRLEDVRWSKQGEGREWDRGKYVNEDGQIDVKAPW